ncbi:neprilysin-2 [Drosophila innubila]|uniref:neprilysin-2 n=1 Tax=Drosophila innubila TaxID=198719 RepID=UPI00148E3AF5|nr:neprilysin-2 [Drosophila innubila]
MKGIRSGFVIHALFLLCVSFASWVEGDLLSLSQLKLDTRIQPQEQLISQHNDSAYVQRIMRLAKSAEMRSYMQPELDACDNFFDYSCGNWAKIHPANDAQPRETNYQQLLTNGFHHKQQKLLEQPADVDIDDPAVLKLKQFYASCLRYRQIPQSLYRQQLLEIASEFGHMPALGSGETKDFDWIATVAKIKQKYGLDIILLLQESTDPHDKSQKRVYVGQPPQIIVEPNIRSTEKHISQQLEQHLGLQPDVAEVKAQEIVELEILLAKGMVNRPLGVLAQPRNTSELFKVYDTKLNLTRYVELSLQRLVPAEELLYEHVPTYHAHLIDVISKTPTQVLANYIFYKLLENFYYDQGTSSAVGQCMESCRKQFPELLNQLVYRHYGDAATLTDIDFVWQQIKRSLTDVIEGSTMDWLTVETRSQLLQQLNATRLLINGHANVNFTEIYSNLVVNQTYLDNLRAVLRYRQRHMLATFTEATTLVPFYDEIDNLVTLPVSLLQPNFLWSRYYPRALRYASLGAILAQQLSHSFDNHSAWDSQSKAEFGKRKACFKHQYERLRYAGEYLPPSELQDENIADNTALQVAYHAYMDYLGNLASSALSTEKLPQLALSPKQLFFVSYAQLWCNDANEQFRDKQSLLATRTPSTLRIHGALTNFAAFASTFGCSSDDRMNPSQKCHMYAINLNQ